MSDTSPLDALHHIAIQVQNVARAVEWYREHFRTAIIYQDNTWAMLKFRNVYLALVIPGEHPPHVALIHTEAQKFGPLTQHRDGTRSIYIADSEGNQVEIMAPPPLEPVGLRRS